MSKRRWIVALSLLVGAVLVVIGLGATAPPAEARCWDYMARYDDYHQRCMIADPQNCMVVRCQDY